MTGVININNMKPVFLSKIVLHLCQIIIIMTIKSKIQLMFEDERIALAENKWLVLTLPEYAHCTHISYEAVRARVFYAEKHNTQIPGVMKIDKRMGTTLLWVKDISNLPIIPELKYQRRIDAPHRRVLVKNARIEVPGSRPKRYYIDVYLDGKFFRTESRYTKLVNCEAYFAGHNPDIKFKEIKAKYQLKPE